MKSIDANVHFVGKKKRNTKKASNTIELVKE